MDMTFSIFIKLYASSIKSIHQIKEQITIILRAFVLAIVPKPISGGDKHTVVVLQKTV
jgi:hypothetical protein